MNDTTNKELALTTLSLLTGALTSLCAAKRLSYWKQDDPSVAKLDTIISSLRELLNIPEQKEVN